MNRVTDDPIALEPLLTETADPSAGALVVFGGTVRDHHEGRRVAAIAYSAYRPMAERVLAELEAEVTERYGVQACRIVHRVGELAVGEESVVVVVRAAHRAEAFEAGRYAIDTLKVRAPFWKDEHYEDGTRAYQSGVPLAP
ncbi:molybdenum cofactor biosynthesis protein MoaE [Halorhodospira halophila]|uniref:Molybdopterin synthase catalytic subunit n=1 Tax=Halorhodospira halophila (strain DSM 244 / SL1) TaxID=349124 RepID=A1WWR6_HALHL|nr:molybdenum cofactor biosynthesis protein MoaE [Halorhodospira halophila]ABM62128.1 molybdopterin synthase subunit MoaE [Halorhodospira halophila SL1]MBK1729456.1 molybdopterin converting factor [Halorhodospira halophila]